jgi:hypothetical protein
MGTKNVPYNSEANAESDEFSLHPHELFSTAILKLYFHMCLEMTSVLFPSGFLIKIFYTSLISAISVTGPTHLVQHDSTTITTFSDKYKL